MTFMAKDAKTQEELFLYWLRSIHTAETRIIERLPDLIDKTGTGPLRQGLRSYLTEVETRISRLEKIFADIDASPDDAGAQAIDALLEEARAVMTSTMGEETVETALTAVARMIVGYELARYTTLLEWSNELGRETCTTLLDEAWTEVCDAQEMLTKAAEERKNRSA
tara:strand:- start:10 stop:510 length:501 start_codon:yes stop_codon:yes gene_type:complete